MPPMPLLPANEQIASHTPRRRKKQPQSIPIESRQVTPSRRERQQKAHKHVAEKHTARQSAASLPPTRRCSKPPVTRSPRPVATRPTALPANRLARPLRPACEKFPN